MKHFISLGAGVQSSTMALMAAHGEIKPMPDAAIFADTQSEPKAVMKWLGWLEGQLPFPVYRVTAGSLMEDSLILRTSQKTKQKYIRALIPAWYESDRGRALLGRKCTADYKVRPLKRKQRELANVPHGCKDIRVTTWIGISSDEAHRMKPSQDKWNTMRWPLIEKNMTRLHCLEWMQRNGYPAPPRSACIFCPFHSDYEWGRLKLEDPKAFKEAADFEAQLQDVAEEQTGTARLQGKLFLHNSMQSLEDIDFNVDERQMNLFGNECEGMCGL